MVKFNINYWIMCKEGNGSLVECKVGILDCKVVKNIVFICYNIVFDEICFLIKELLENFGFYFYYFKSFIYLKMYYYWESFIKFFNWFIYDFCG